MSAAVAIDLPSRFDPAAFRAEFPALERLTYLASCSLGARSVRLSRSLDRMLDLMDSVGAPWEIFESETERLRSGIAAMAACASERIALLPDVATAAFQAVSALDWTERTMIVSSRAEFPSVAHVWLAQRRLGAEVVFLDDGGNPDEIVGRYAEAVDERTALVSIPSASYLDGRRFPVARICEIAGRAGCSSFVDCYQTFAVEPLDLDSLGCEYAAAGAMKYLTGLPGIAFLYSKRNFPGHSTPLLTGRRGRRFPLAFNPFVLDWAEGAQRFETGTQSVPSVFAAVDAVSQFVGLDLARVREHVFALIALTFDTLSAAGETFATVPTWESQAAHLTLLDPNPARLANYLAAKAIVVSPRGLGVRLSFHLYNDGTDVARLAAALARYRAR